MSHRLSIVPVTTRLALVALAALVVLAMLAAPAHAQVDAVEPDPARLWMHFDSAAPDAMQWSNAVMNVQEPPSLAFQDARPFLGSPAWTVGVETWSDAVRVQAT